MESTRKEYEFQKSSWGNFNERILAEWFEKFGEFKGEGSVNLTVRTRTKFIQNRQQFCSDRTILFTLTIETRNIVKSEIDTFRKKFHMELPARISRTKECIVRQWIIVTPGKNRERKTNIRIVVTLLEEEWNNGGRSRWIQTWPVTNLKNCFPANNYPNGWHILSYTRTGTIRRHV